MDNLNHLIGLVTELENTAKEMIDKIVTPEVMDALTPSDRSIINDIQSALKNQDGTVAERLENIQKTIKKYGL